MKFHLLLVGGLVARAASIALEVSPDGAISVDSAALLEGRGSNTVESESIDADDIDEMTIPSYQEAFAHDVDGAFWAFDDYEDCVAKRNATYCTTLADAYQHHGEGKSMERRQGTNWNSPGEFMIYEKMDYLGRFQIIRRDSCIQHACNPQAILRRSDHGVMEETIRAFRSLCDNTVISACRLPGRGPWRLRIRGIPIWPRTCRRLNEDADFWADHGELYGTLHDDAVNNKLVGVCYGHKSPNANFSRTCAVDNHKWYFHTLVRCRWYPV